jgi:hypothetical protein
MSRNTLAEDPILATPGGGTPLVPSAGSYKQRVRTPTAAGAGGSYIGFSPKRCRDR